MMHNAPQERKCLLHQPSRYLRGMAGMSERLKEARERSGYTSAKSAAEAMGIPVATYIQHENGARGFPADRAQRYARFFRTTPEWILYGTGKDVGKFVALGPQLFVKAEVAAGVWREAWELAADEWEAFTGRADVSAPIRERFGLRVVGESMNDLYPPGSVLECVAYHDQPLTNGKRVIVQRERDGECETTVKEYHKDDNGIVWLVPRSRNPAFQTPFRADLPDPGISRVEIIGIVVASVRPE